jgi:hypothetical protein
MKLLPLTTSPKPATEVSQHERAATIAKKNRNIFSLTFADSSENARSARYYIRTHRVHIEVLKRPN